ncbi:MAG: hypothetical protein J0L51_07985 [Rhizobiales bacterium]|nr:hypothetical protein [Hyphomicrobiales bacterium]
MPSIGNIFGRKVKDDPARRRVRDWAVAILGDEPVPTFTISEIDCGDPTCPGLETIILVMREGEATQAAKIRKPLAEISETDLREALQYL